MMIWPRGGAVATGNRVNLRFAGGSADAEDLETEILSILNELADSGTEVARSAVGAGLSPSDLAGARVNVSQEGKGFGPVVFLIAITVPVAAHIVNKFWDDVIWPRVKDKLGADALGEREEE
jgi:hypothetical protein